MTKESLIRLLHVVDYGAIVVAGTWIVIGLIGLLQAKPNGTVFGHQMVILLMAGFAVMLFSLLICWIMP